jgi:ribonuclease E
VAHYLLNKKREELLDIERLYRVSIDIRGRKSFVASQFELVVHKREREEKSRIPVEPIAGNTSEAIPYSDPKDETSHPDRSRGQGRFRGRKKHASGTRHGTTESATPIAPEVPVQKPSLVPEKEEKNEATSSVEGPIGEGATAKVVSETKPDSKPSLIENKKSATSRRHRYDRKKIVPKAGLQKEAEAPSKENESPSTVGPDKPISEKGSPATLSPVEEKELKTPGDEESGKTVVVPKKGPIKNKTVKRTGKTVAKKKTATVKKVTTRRKKVNTEVNTDGKNEGEPAPVDK